MSMTESLRQLSKDGRPLAQQLPVAAAAAAAAVLVIAGFALLAALVDEPFRLFSKEPVESLGARPYVGWLAHLGAVVWFVGAVAAVLAGAVLRRAGSGRPALFLLAAGAYTTALVMDDLFLLHESVYPKLGAPEELVYLTYGVLLTVLVWRFPADVARHGAVLLGLALLFWGSSVAFDVVQEVFGVHLHLLEDGAKLVGIALWSAFLVGAAFRDLLQAARPASALPAPAIAAGSEAGSEER